MLSGDATDSDVLVAASGFMSTWADDSDLGLALAIESRDVLREDLRLVVMSATIDGTRVIHQDVVRCF